MTKPIEDAEAAILQAPIAATRGSDILALDALTLSDAIRQRRISCVELMQATLARIEALNPLCNALVSLQAPEALLQQAAQRDRELQAGIYHGWMHGFPHAVKDLSDVAGLVTSHGSPLLRDSVARADSVFVERIRAAGAIFIGKSNVPEFGLGSQTYNTVFGTTRNAWDSGRTAGGSSGGAAVALALRMLPLADGSDMMGSLRNPAAYNNVFGLRPSHGRVPGDGPEYLQQLGYAGPMARSVPELARLLATMAGFDARDPLSISEDPAVFATALACPGRDLRIGWLGDFDGYLPMETGVLALCHNALDTFSSLGCQVAEAGIGFEPQRLWQCWLVLRNWLVAARMAPLYHDTRTRDLLKPELVWEIEQGLGLDAMQVAAASAVRGDWYRQLLSLFERYDFLVLPSAQLFPFDADTHWPRQIGTRRMDTYHRWMEVVVAGSLSACPVINVPAGFSAAGLPMGLQIIAPMRQELRLLQLANAYEQASGWTLGRQPPLLRS